jgi:hypothetical protein
VGVFEACADLVRRCKPSGNATCIVREGTSIKQSYLIESAFIRYCFERSAEAPAEPPARCYVYHVDKSYVREGVVDPSLFFVEADVTKRVGRIYDRHFSQIEELAALLREDPALTQFAERRCARPHSCPVCGTSEPAVPDDHVTTLYRGGALVDDLLEAGITSIPEIPASRLSHPRQRIQQQSLVRQSPHVDEKALSAFLDRLTYPLSYLDFEAVSMAVPPYDGSRPWEHVPYLYSVHQEASPGAQPMHSCYLMDPGSDQRRELATHLVESIGHSGSVVVYNASFERGILARLAELLPELTDRLLAIADRVVDLLEPFSEFSFYHHTQRGKVSLKTVLPILADDLYEEQEIQDGYTANLAYRHLSEGRGSGQTRAILDGLIAYCAMDTLAMVKVVHRLTQIVRES